MKIEHIRFRNYKAYGAEQDLELLPLTLLFGKNNSGKSAAVRLPRLVLAALAGGHSAVLPLKVGELRFGETFLELIHGQDFFQQVMVGVKAKHEGESLDLSLELYLRGLMQADAAPEVWTYDMRKPEERRLGEPSGRPPPRLRLDGLLPDEPKWDRWRRAASDALDAGEHLGPTRRPVEPHYGIQRVNRVGMGGEEVPAMLAGDAGLAATVGSWFHRHLEGWRLNVVRAGDSFNLQVTRGDRLTTNLSQAGEGLQQVLPVVTQQLARQRAPASDAIDIIEQPELHLHAAAQAPLADLFIDSALREAGTTLVETNSEPLLLRTQRRVAEGKIDPARIAIYFVEQDGSGSRLRRIHLNADGEVDGWPTGVFEEDFHEVAAIRRAQRGRRAAQ